MMSKKDFERIAEGFRYVANDPTADLSTVSKMLNEFCNAAESRNPNFDRTKFIRAATKRYSEE